MQFVAIHDYANVSTFLVYHAYQTFIVLTPTPLLHTNQGNWKQSENSMLSTITCNFCYILKLLEHFSALAQDFIL